MPNREQKEFTFMSEQLKKKPFYKKRWFQKGAEAVTLAVVFGAMAGVVFAVTQPWAKGQFGKPEDPAQVYVVREETETETEAPQTETEEKAAPQTVIEQKELEIGDYEMLYQKMSALAEKVSPAMVIVTCKTSSRDWFNEVIEDHAQFSGLVIAANAQEYLILAGGQELSGAEHMTAAFTDGSVAEAELRKLDSVTGLAVLSVRREELGAGAQEIAPAKLESQEEAGRGEPVIALGTPVGNEMSMFFGMVTSVAGTSAVDSQYRVISTDILGGEKSSGILIDLEGRVVGVIAQSFSPSGSQMTLTALASGDIQDLVTDLVNIKDRPAIGITGKDIDEATAQEYDMPRGIYVRSVAADSPAMYAGVYQADIITSINDISIDSIDEYEKEIMRHSPEEVVRLGIKRATMDGYVDMELPVQLGLR